MRQTCSRSCAVACSWRTNREARLASISAAQKRRGAQIAEFNRQRWARLGEREKLSERNRRAWADAKTRERLVTGIRERQRTPEMRRFYSDLRRAMWRDPAYRARVTEIVAASHRTPEYRALFSALLRERWRDPVWREKWMAALRRRYVKVAPPPKTLVMPPLSPPPAAPDRRSAARIAEDEAIAEFLRRRGARVMPPVGDPALGKLPDLVWNRETRKYARSQVSP